MRVHLTKFAKDRHTENSGLSHWTGGDDRLISMVEANLESGNFKVGYRDGVLLVNVPPLGFYSSIIQLNPGDMLVGEYVARKEGEDPRKSSYSLNGKKMPASRVDVVIYHHSVLIEKYENETDADYEIVSVNASPTHEDTPIPVGALIANHLELSGGTATRLSNEEFVEMLRRSVNFWKDKSHIAPEKLQNHFRVLKNGLLPPYL